MFNVSWDILSSSVSVISNTFMFKSRKTKVALQNYVQVIGFCSYLDIYNVNLEISLTAFSYLTNKLLDGFIRKYSKHDITRQRECRTSQK